MTDEDGDVVAPWRRHIADSLDDTLDLLEAAGNREKSDRVPTGIPDLDELLGGGMWPGHLIVLGGRAGMGTSSLALGFVRAAALAHKIPTLLFTPDMSAPEVNIRLLAAAGKIPITHLRNGLLSDQGWSDTAEVIPALAVMPREVVPPWDGEPADK